jgi:hypothetical protein
MKFNRRFERFLRRGRAAVRSACSGTASLSLGLLAATLGDQPAAVTHLEEAVRHNDALGAFMHAASLADVLEDSDKAAAAHASRSRRGGSSARDHAARQSPLVALTQRHAGLTPP